MTSVKSSAIWISHRGLSQYYDENTLAAFKSACKAGFSWLETDLHSTNDNHIVLCHELELGRLSSSTGNILQMSRSELENIQLNKGEKLLFLDEFMLEFKQQNWVFDIKPDTAKQTMSILTTHLINNKNLLSKIIFLFWSKEQQALFLSIFPEAVCFPRIEECYRAGIASLLGLAALGNIKTKKIYSLTPKIFGLPLLNKRIVKLFHQQGAYVIGYLPESNSEIQQCLDAEVDYILSNQPPI
ncbi:MAG: glycerophosphodiester phosphodiesterase [gamma proteobacterium symbiont of Taylorina sp.]|nr:glycerophosphodiester phosphodiesterase [gamma proteobacterium symbiont of Taylorina sp.]